MTHKTVPIDLKKVEQGSDFHFSLLMATYGLNFVTGQDRKDLLAWGRDIWNAALEHKAAPPDNTVQELREQVAELQKEAAWVRNKLGIPVDSGFLTGEVTLAGKMHNMVAHAKGYEKYVVTGKCDDKSGEIARQSVHIDTLEQQLRNMAALVEKKNEALKLAREKLQIECGGTREFKGGMPTQVLFQMIDTLIAEIEAGNGK